MLQSEVAFQEGNGTCTGRFLITPVRPSDFETRLIKSITRGVQGEKRASGSMSSVKVTQKISSMMLLNGISLSFQTHCQDKHSFKIFGTAGMVAYEVKKLGSFKCELTLKSNNVRLTLGTKF